MAEATTDRVDGALKWLERKGTRRNREGMARYGIVAPKVFGVSMSTMQTLARQLGKDHELALCFKLFDRTPHAWKQIDKWTKRRDEFVKRAGFALLASVAVHDKRAADEPFIRSLALIEREAHDERNFVKKGVSWALRAIGHRGRPLHVESVRLAHRLAESADTTERWVGKDVLRDLLRPQVSEKIDSRALKKAEKS